MQTSAKLLNCMFFGAVIASVYFMYASFVQFEPWTSVGWAVVVAFASKCLAVALQDYVKRYSVESRPDSTDFSTAPSTIDPDNCHSNGIELKASKEFSPDVNNAIANLTSPDPISSTKVESTWSKEAYELGFALGKQWTGNHDKAKPVTSLDEFGDGKEWLSRQAENLAKLKGDSDEPAFDSDKIPGDPSPSFLAGFIDGAQAP